MIPQDVIDDILNRVSLVDLLKRYNINLKKVGRNYFALCPFHKEKTPSFSISEEKGLYYCHGCHASGNIITFMKDYLKLSYLESIKELSKIAGIDIDKYLTNNSEELDYKHKQILYEITKEAMIYYHRKLLESSFNNAGLEYLVKQRKLKLDTIKTYRLGYGGDGLNDLFNFLINKGFKEEDILKTGLIIKTKDGIIDRFKERVIFPIMDKESRVVGFGGRILSDDKKLAKYINSPENEIFKKGNILFSFNLSKDYIIKEREVIFVEGYMDVIGLWQNDVKNVVASLGTALTEFQLNMIKNYADKIYFIFDGDNAGIEAANRAIDMSVNSDLEQWVVILNTKDPFDFIVEYGKEEFNNYIQENKLSPIDFKFKYFSRNINPEKDKKRFIISIFPYIKNIKSLIVQDDYLKRISNYINISYELVLLEFRNYLRKSPDFGKFISDSGINENNKIRDLELNFLSLYILLPEHRIEISEIINSNMLFSEDLKEIIKMIDENSSMNIQQIILKIKEQRLIEFIAKYANQENIDPLVLKEFAFRIKILYLKDIMKKNNNRLVEVEKNGDYSEMNNILKENQSLKEQIENLESRIKEIEIEINFNKIKEKKEEVINV